MILVYDTDDNLVMLNPEYIIGAHQVGTNKVQVDCVGEIVYTVQGTAEDLHDAWSGVCEYEIEEDEDDESADRGGEAEATARVSGVPYAVPVKDIRGCPSSRGDNDE